MPIVFEGVGYSYERTEERAVRKGGLLARFSKRGGATDRQVAAGADGAKGGGTVANVSSQDVGAREAASANGATAGNVAASASMHAQPVRAWGSRGNERWALRGIDFTLEDGEFIGIAGHTGSGKSTLIQHVNGLLHPTAGRVLVDGRDLADKRTARACRGRIGMLFQYPEHQLFAASVFEDVAFGPRNLGVPESEIDARVREALKAVELDGEALREKSPFELSGGQQRRVALAGVLAMHPQVLVLDEPAAGLDPQAHAELLALIAGLKRQGLSILMSSHNMDDLARMSDRILVLDRGEQLMLGTPETVFADPERLRRVGLDAPFAQNVARTLVDAGIPLDRPLYDVFSLADDLAKRYREVTAGDLARPTEEVSGARDGGGHAAPFGDASGERGDHA